MKLGISFNIYFVWYIERNSSLIILINHSIYKIDWYVDRYFLLNSPKYSSLHQIVDVDLSIVKQLFKLSSLLLICKFGLHESAWFTNLQQNKRKWPRQHNGNYTMVYILQN